MYKLLCAISTQAFKLLFQQAASFHAARLLILYGFCSSVRMDWLDAWIEWSYV